MKAGRSTPASARNPAVRPFPGLSRHGRAVAWLLALSAVPAGCAAPDTREAPAAPPASSSQAPAAAPAPGHDLITLEVPRPGERVDSPLTVRGAARGSWYFEGDFPVNLTDWDGRIIAEGVASAQGPWMTRDFVPFVATLELTPPEYGDHGFLILRKANPTGLPRHDDAYEIRVRFARRDAKSGDGERWRAGAPPETEATLSPPSSGAPEPPPSDVGAVEA